MPDHTANNLLLSIRALLPSLNEQEQKVGNYVLEHPEEVVHMAMNELAERCQTSDTTVFRFCKRVASEGYQEFKIRLAQELGSGPVTTYMAVTPQDTFVTAVHKVTAANAKALQDTLNVLDMAALERAVAALLSARQVHIYGVGGAAIAALELEYRLIRLGILAVAQTDVEMQITSASLLQSSDVAVGISHSGASSDTYQVLEIASGTGATILAITNHPESPIARLAGINLYTAAEEASAHHYPLGARIAQVALIDMLYSCLSIDRSDEAERSLERVGQMLLHRHL